MIEGKTATVTSSAVSCPACGTINHAGDTICTSCSQSLPVSSHSLTGLLPPGHTLRQRFRVVARVGKGGFGAVYQGQDIQLANRLVAIKEMSQRGLTLEELQEASEAFERETHLLATLSHPSLPAVYDYFSEGGRTYLVMEFIQGDTLEDVLGKAPGGTFAVDEAIAIGLQLCNCLEYLHTRQPPIIFRDLKPANVMLTAEKHLYLIDFGIARFFKPGQGRDTVAFGSPGYAAPEQYGKAQTTTQADIYSLGATLHHLLSGYDPSLTPFLFAPLHLSGNTGLEGLISRMLEQDAQKRPGSIAAIQRELERLSSAASTPLPPAKTKEQWMEEAAAHLDAERYEEALIACDQTISLDPAHVQAYLNKGNALGSLELYQAAVATYDLALRLDQSNAHACFNKGVALAELERYAEALAAFEQAIQRDPTDIAAHQNKGALLLTLQRPLDALAAYDAAIRLAPTNVLAYRTKGDALRDHQYYQEAVTAYDQALRLDPKDISACTNKGFALAQLQRYKEALAVYQQALRLDPKLGLAHYNKGALLQRLGKTGEAEQAFQKARKLGYNPE